MRILLIEDDFAVSQSIALTLRADAMCVDTADRGEDGIEMAQHHDYDAVVLDLGLPDISGFEVVRRLRQAKIATPLLMLSGSAVLDDRVRALTSGADGYMTKPFSGEELTARLRGTL